MRSQQPDRRAWFDAATVSVLSHVVLLLALVMTNRNLSPDAVRDVPNTRGMLSAAGVSGMAPPPTTGPLAVSCTYVADAATRVARLSSGPPHAHGTLGCKPTLTRDGAIPWPSRLGLTYDSDGGTDPDQHACGKCS